MWACGCFASDDGGAYDSDAECAEFGGGARDVRAPSEAPPEDLLLAEAEGILGGYSNVTMGAQLFPKVFGGDDSDSSDSDGLEEVYSPRPPPRFEPRSPAARSLQPIALAPAPKAMLDQRRESRASLRRLPTTDQLTADLERDVALVRPLGRGSFGTVSLGVHVPSLRLVAVKEVRVDDADEDRSLALLLEEVHALHDNLVPLDESGAPRWLFKDALARGALHPCDQLVTFYGAYAVGRFRRQGIASLPQVGRSSRPEPRTSRTSRTTMLKHALVLALAASANALRAPKSAAKVLTLRGGADIAIPVVGKTITPEVGVYVWLVGGGIYALELLGITEPDFSLKYWGKAATRETRNAFEWMALMIGWTTAVTYWSLKCGTDAAKLCQVGALLWASGLAKTLLDIQSGKEKMTESPYILAAFTALMAYLGFA